MWKTFFDFTDENSYKGQSCRISKNRNKWFEPKSFWTKILFGKCEKKTSEPVKKTFEVILNEKIHCTEHEGDEIRCSQSCLSYYQPLFAEHVTKCYNVGNSLRHCKNCKKKIRFWILQTKPLKSRTCKECEKKKRW